jgi:hypothetical protein
MSSVVISGDSSGTVSLTVPSVAGTNTATLPAATGTVMVSGNQPAFSAYASGSTSVATSTWVKMPCNTEEFDTNSNYDNATNYRFTPTVAGYYQINGYVEFNSGTGNGFIAIYKNGSAFRYGMHAGLNSINGLGMPVSTIMYFNGTTDYIELYATQNSGISVSTGSGSASVYFGGSLIRNA